MTDKDVTPKVPFGSVLADQMVISSTVGGVFGAPHVEPMGPLPLHPGTHALHYGSSCFEGLKAHRASDGHVRLFRAPAHAARMRVSAETLCLPVPEYELLVEMMRTSVRANLEQVPESPGALYVRPTLLGVDPNIGAAATPSSEALLYVIASPVGDYFDSSRALSVAIETQLPRSTPQFGRVKTGANYAMALGITMRARAAGADQVLFAPGGDVQETGASNFMLLDDSRLVTKPLDGSFLAGVTRDSILTLARDFGYQVEEREIAVDEVLAWAAHGEAALMGTAAVVAGVGTFTHDGTTITVGNGGVGPNTQRLRQALIEIQRGESPDRWGWTELIEA
ncbi:MAG: branched-chain-amino-acid transaminase [Acidimicrobiaceae bacterium]|nr:branched-chain-amino-acid transaminase [Acidimicrobiaceae bacterium]